MLDEFALFGFAGHESLAFDGDLANVQPELGFALVFVRPMAGVAIFRQDGVNVAIELNLIGRGQRAAAAKDSQRHLRQRENWSSAKRHKA